MGHALRKEEEVSEQDIDTVRAFWDANPLFTGEGDLSDPKAFLRSMTMCI